MSIVAGPIDASAAPFAGLDVAPDLAVLIHVCAPYEGELD